MWECSYAKEPVDYALFWQRFFKKIWLILATTLLGGIFVGVPYYLVNVSFGEGVKYKMSSEYYLDYAEDGSGATYEYFNYYTWSEIVDTDEFIAMLQEQLPHDFEYSKQMLQESTDATIESDIRFLYTTVLTEDAETTKVLNEAMEQAVIQYAGMQKEFVSAKVVTSPENVEVTYPDVRCARAYVLGCVLGLFIGLCYVCIVVISDSSIYLPHTIESRYHIKALGCEGFTETKNNICYTLRNVKNVALILTDDRNETAEKGFSYIEKTVEDTCRIIKVRENILAETFKFEDIRNMDGVILMIKSGANNGRKIERVVEQIKRQDIQILGAFLYNEDSKLLHRYYR